MYAASTHTHTHTHTNMRACARMRKKRVFPHGVQKKITMKVQLNEAKKKKKEIYNS